MEQVLYDRGALIAIGRSRNSARVEDHLVRLDRGDHIIVPAPVVAQVIRDPRRQARLMVTLRSCDIVPLEGSDARRVGRLLALSGTSDVVDGFVAVKAAETGATVITSDPGDIRHLLSTLGLRLPVLQP